VRSHDRGQWCKAGTNGLVQTVLLFWRAFFVCNGVRDLDQAPTISALLSQMQGSSGSAGDIYSWLEAPKRLPYGVFQAACIRDFIPDQNEEVLYISHFHKIKTLGIYLIAQMYGYRWILIWLVCDAEACASKPNCGDHCSEAGEADIDNPVKGPLHILHFSSSSINWIPSNFLHFKQSKWAVQEPVSSILPRK